GLIAVLKSAAEQREFETSAGRLIGLGVGSTPTGDDLAHGAMIAMHLLAALHGRVWFCPNISDMVMKRTTPLGRHMLEMGRSALTPEPVLFYIDHLLSGDSLAPSLDELRQIGSDTGLSIAVGIYLVIRDYVSTIHTRSGLVS
ncbi:MAG: DUF2877 domain-containing protein, partial [Rectinema sp.]|nr:DUF2877 domain-containing protein [Rectinema sp.]